MSGHSARRPSALQFHEDAQDDIASSAREENPALSKRLPFIHAPSTPMFFSHSQDGAKLDTSNPYEEKLENSAQSSPKLGMHDSRGGSISGAAGLREKGLGVSQADWDEDDQDTYAPKGRRPSRLGGSLSGTAHYLPMNKQPLLGGEDGSDLYPSRLPKGFLGRKLPIASLLPALILGAILVALWDSRSPATPSINKTPAVSDSLWTDASDIEAGSSLRSHPNGHAYLRESALHAGDAAHPIFELIRNATEQWDEKVSRQSTTLGQAVREYRRRYNRAPPKGFDHWYAFAKKNNVGLLDEYDSIDQSIKPFLSLPRSILLKRQQSLLDSPNTHTMQVRKGKLKIDGEKKDLKRAKEQGEMLQQFVEWLPDMDIVMSAHDGPSVMLDDKLRDLHISKAERGEVLTASEAETVDDDAAVWGFQLACPAHSRLRRAQLGLEIGALEPGPSYVSDHQATMDLCANPEWQYLHGFTSWPGPRPMVLMPLFSFARSTLHSDLLCVPLEQYWDVPPEDEDPPWEEKSHNKVVWRGSTTGVWFERETWWRSSQRMRLVALSNDRDADGAWGRKVRFTERQRGKESIVEKVVDPEALEQRYLDVGFAGEMGQCTVEDGSCEAVPKYIKFVESLTWPAQDQYKYIIDVDGNAWSGRFHRLLTSNALVLKSTIFPEWYAERIQPWLHYVPVKIDYTDLYDIMAFFSGDLDGKNGHDDLAKKIAYDGKAWANQYWRYVDMQAYAFRLYLEWARVTSANPSQMDFVM